jgi:ATP-dependent RNA helicase DeaD
VQIVVATADAEAAAAVIAASVRLIGDRPIGALAATSVARATRLAKLRPPHIVSGTPDTLVQLVRGTVLKLESVRAIGIAWADELVARDESASLETLMTDVPKDAARTIVASVLNPAVEELIERYARRARREVAHVPEPREPISLEYVLVGSGGRPTMLRRLLDQVDPPSALVFARVTDGEASVQEQIRSLGYPADGPVRAGAAAAPGTALAILYDLPATHEELREAVSGAGQSIALIRPRQLESLRALSLGGTLRPHVLPDVIEASRAKDANLLSQLRRVLDSGGVARELLSLEPLLEDYDGAEVAAAALKLLEQERAAQKTRAAQEQRVAQAEPATVVDRAQSAPREHSGSMVSLFVSVGTREGVRPADLVGMITSKAGVAGSDVGRIDIRESHSTIEVAAEVADQVIDKASGTVVKGRRAMLRRDEGPPKRDARREGRDSSYSREGRGTGRPREGRSDFRPREPRRDGPRRDNRDDTRPKRGPRPPRPSPRA